MARFPSFRVSAVLAIACTFALGPIGAIAADAPAAAGTVVLETRRWSADGSKPAGTIWRTFETWQTDVARTEKGELVNVDPLTPRAALRGNSLDRLRVNSPNYTEKAASKLEIYPAKAVHGSAYPAEGWRGVEFDDSAWAREPSPQRTLYGAIALRCMRGKFEVLDPAKVTDMALNVRFRGGAVAYLNGKEIGRASMPAGPITPQTLAEDYPKEAYIGPDGVLIEQGLYWLDGYKKSAAADFAKKASLVESGPHGYDFFFRWHSISVDAAGPGYFGSKDPEVINRYKSRCRELKVPITADMLRKGANVLAIEIHRAPAWEGMFTSPSYEDGKKTLMSVNTGATFWDRSELEDLSLTCNGGDAAIVANVGAPKGVQVWNHPANVDIDPSYFGDPNESLQPIKLNGLKNGTYSGQLIVSSTASIKGLNVSVTELKGPGGTIGADAVQVAYPRLSDGVVGGKTPPGFASMGSYPITWPLFDVLEPNAPKDVSKVAWDHGRTFPPLQPVWLTVRVPRDAKAGDYSGTVTVKVDGEKPVTTSLVVGVEGDWVLPDSNATTPYMGFFECPDAVAKHYKVAMWSDEHWKLLDKVFQIMGQVGAKDVYIPLVAKTHLGNPNGMVRWVKQADGSFKVDTSIAEKYLDLAIKHLGKVPVVCLYTSTRSQYGFEKAVEQPIVTSMDPATGELKDMLPPKFGTPESQAFWKPAIEQMKEVLAKRGLEKSMMFGYMADGPGPDAKGNQWGMPTHMADFRAISPQTKWMASSHFPPNAWKAGPSLSAKDFIGELSWVRGLAMNVHWMDENDDAMFKPTYGWRDHAVPLIMLVGSRSRSPDLYNDHCPDVARWRIALEAVMLSKQDFGDGAFFYTYQGCGPWGADFWENECETFDSYHNVALSENPVRWLIGAGEAGPVPTCRTRMLQEGLQEAETRIFVQNAILDADKKAKLGPDLAKRCKELCDERTRAFSYITQYRYNDGADAMPRLRLIPDVTAWQEAAIKLDRLAGEVGKALGK